jgi:hypothetical protein
MRRNSKLLVGKVLYLSIGQTRRHRQPSQIFTVQGRKYSVLQKKNREADNKGKWLQLHDAGLIVPSPRNQQKQSCPDRIPSTQQTSGKRCVIGAKKHHKRYLSDNQDLPAMAIRRGTGICSSRCPCLLEEARLTLTRGLLGFDGSLLTHGGKNDDVYRSRLAWTLIAPLNIATYWYPSHQS